MNEFYDIADEGTKPSRKHQLQNLGAQRIMAIIGGGRGSRSTEYYAPTTSEDYDRYFAHTLCSIKPPYHCPDFIEHHLVHYSDGDVSKKTKFIKQLRYVTLPMIQEFKGKEVYVEIIKEWIDENTLKQNEKPPSSTVVNHIITGAINAPTQFVQNSNDANLQQQSTYTNDDIEELLEALKKDIIHLSTEQREDISAEIHYISMQQRRGRDIKSNLESIALFIKDVGINFFANLIASPTFELLKPYMSI